MNSLWLTLKSPLKKHEILNFTLKPPWALLKRNPAISDPRFSRIKRQRPRRWPERQLELGGRILDQSSPFTPMRRLCDWKNHDKATVNAGWNKKMGNTCDVWDIWIPGTKIVDGDTTLRDYWYLNKLSFYTDEIPSLWEHEASDAAQTERWNWDELGKLWTV